MADVTFRDFAGAIMRGDAAAAGTVLETLLGLAPDAARAAADHFHAQTTAQGPAFMGKAMGLRAAVASGSDAEVSAVLADCFALQGEALAHATRTVKG